MARESGQLEVTPPDLMQPPGVHPENMDVVDAFNKVGSCVHTHPMGGVGPPIWADIEPVLRLHGMWEMELQDRLAQFMGAVRRISKSEFEAAQATGAGGDGDVWLKKS